MNWYDVYTQFHNNILNRIKDQMVYDPSPVSEGDIMSWHRANICIDCWIKEFGNIKPRPIKEPKIETCCYCNSVNTDGIYFRESPDKLECQHARKS